MTHDDTAFYPSPVPAPGPDASDPGPYRGIYGMPAFLTVPTPDLRRSAEFWRDGLGFIELFSLPGRLVHLRRWAFQDVLLVPADSAAPEGPGVPAGAGVSFACVPEQLDVAAAACRALGTGQVGEPHDTAWNTCDLEVVTPEGLRIVLTAARAVPEAPGLPGLGESSGGTQDTPPPR